MKKTKNKERLNGFGIFKGAKPFKEERDPHRDLWKSGLQKHKER